MSSDSPQPEPDVCPHCRKQLPQPLSSAVCPECGERLAGETEKPGETAPLSPFDDLFDDQGSPSWGQSSSTQESLKAEEPLEFPETVDPFESSDDLVLQPLEGESKQLFDFGVQAKVPENYPASEAASHTPAKPAAGEEPHTASPPKTASSPKTAATETEAESELAPLPFDDESPASRSDLELGEMPKLEPSLHSSGSSQDDPDQPLRIEGLESESPSGDLASVRCRICDSLVYIQPSQLGTKVKCPECYSEILAEQAAPRRSSSSAYQKMQADSYVLTVEPAGGKSEPDLVDEYRLSEPVERPKVEVPSHYGLEPEKADLLAPLQPGAEHSGPRPTGDASAKTKLESPRPNSETKPAPTRTERWQEPVAAAAKANAAEKKEPGSPTESKPAGNATAGKLPPYWQQRPTQPEPVVDDSTGTKLEISLEEMTTPGQGILSWMTTMVQDTWFWICFGIATLSLGFGYFCFDTVADWLDKAGEKKLGAIVSSILLGIPGVLAFLLGMVLTVVISALLFHLGGRKQPKLSDWTGYNFNDWAPAVGFVSFAFAIAALPGLLLGILVALVTGSITPMPILTALSVALLAPLLAIGVCRSDSPFGVFDSKVIKLFSFEDVDWLKYLPGSLAAFFLFLIGTLFLLLSGLVWSTIGAALQVAGWVIFGSLTGLYSGLMVEKANQNESRP
jgi:predicted RNA-binding Zn-ribbon protein involved in translation (DUF1610 family)